MSVAGHMDQHRPDEDNTHLMEKKKKKCLYTHHMDPPASWL